MERLLEVRIEINNVPGVFLDEIVHLEEMPRINWTRLKAVIQIRLMSLNNSIFYVTMIQLSIRDLLMFTQYQPGDQADSNVCLLVN
jgi:hypothetical protein